ncbi:MAG: hypothetical protein JWO31_100, partial [Phycisphaerales bacterium]|nr:hypothetical protein [Phycisphaerales bacterium]
TYLSETPPPNDAKDRVFLVRVSGKKQLVGVVAPKQADPPKSGGQVLVGGVVAGMVEPEMKAGGTARVMIVERGFLISPNVDNGWWNSD